MDPALPPPPGRGPDPIRVMLVDDSAVIRRVVSGVLAGEAGVEVVGTAANGQEALDRVDEYRPHVVVLDVEMPVLDGLHTLRALRPRRPTLPVIMYSTRTSRCAGATLDALASGASDYATKPTSAGSLTETVTAVRQQLVPLVRSWGDLGRRRLDGFVATPPPARRPPAVRRARIDALVIGSSAGGPNALTELVTRLPGDLPVPVLLTQHMPETFTKLLATRLDDRSALTVVEAERGMPVRRGHLYVAKGGVHLVVRDVGGRPRLDFDLGAPEHYCRPAVDVMFRSAARMWGPGLLAVILTGMGRDGVEGARTIVGRGGTVLTQDEETSLVWGMPGAVVAAGLSSETLPLDRMATAIHQRVARSRADLAEIR